MSLSNKAKGILNRVVPGFKLGKYLGELEATIGSGTIEAGSITATELADNAVTANKILDNAVTANKILDAAVSTAKLADDAVDINKLKVVVRPVSVMGGGKVGNSAMSADIGGIVLGFSVYNAGSAVKTCRINTGTGQIDVELAENQLAGQDAQFLVAVLQAPAT